MKKFLLAAVLSLIAPSQQQNLSYSCAIEVWENGGFSSCSGLWSSVCDLHIFSFPVTTVLFVTVWGQPGTKMVVAFQPGPPAIGSFQGCYGILDVNPLKQNFSFFTYTFTQVCTPGVNGNCRANLGFYIFLPGDAFDFTVQGFLIGDSVVNPACGMCSTMAVHCHSP